MILGYQKIESKAHKDSARNITTIQEKRFNTYSDEPLAQIISKDVKYVRLYCCHQFRSNITIVTLTILLPIHND